MSNSSTLYEIQNVSKSYLTPSDSIEILNNINILISKGESVSIVGASGSGKSTLLHLMGALDIPSAGKIFFEGQDLGKMTANQKAHFRNNFVGFVFQFHHLLPEFSTLENVAMQAIISGMPHNKAIQKSGEMLERVGLANRMEHKVTTLSGGERQRAAIARAILMQPHVLLADEPTGNLDTQSGSKVGELLLDLNRELNMTLVVVTHNNELAASMGRSLELRSGVLYDKTSV